MRSTSVEAPIRAFPAQRRLTTRNPTTTTRLGPSPRTRPFNRWATPWARRAPAPQGRTTGTTTGRPTATTTMRREVRGDRLSSAATRRRLPACHWPSNRSAGPPGPSSQGEREPALGVLPLRSAWPFRSGPLQHVAERTRMALGVGLRSLASTPGAGYRFQPVWPAPEPGSQPANPPRRDGDPSIRLHGAEALHRAHESEPPDAGRSAAPRRMTQARLAVASGVIHYWVVVSLAVASTIDCRPMPESSGLAPDCGTMPAASDGGNGQVPKSNPRGGRGVGARIDQIVSLREITPTEVGRVLGVDLVETQQNPYWVFHESRPGADFERVSLKVERHGPAWTLAWDYVAARAPTEAEVDFARYGEVVDVRINPDIPPEGTQTLVFDYQGLVLSIELSARTRRLRGVGLTRGQPSRSPP